ncbi:inorganic phosphate transporter, partial [Bradyrhizobium sp. 25ACV]
LVGGLCGAAIATSQGNWDVLIWNETIDGKHLGLWPKVVMPMLASPLIGFVLGAIFMLILYAVLRKATPHFVNRWFG